ncbi:MAG TPA: hypothetical protein VFV01_00570 [Spirillospora sp.]|nr:hypothetical protein [Spirillospora sp.]
MPGPAPITVLIDLRADPPPAAPVPWAAAQLIDALETKGVPASSGTVDALPQGATVIRLHTDGALGPGETFAIAQGTPGEIVIRAADPRGLAYGLTELADRIRHAADPAEALRTARSPLRAPAVGERGVLRAFSSDVLDRPWLRDHDFWTSYLDELATHRINRLHLAFGMQYNYSHDRDVRDNYLCFAYPFLLRVPGWEHVRVRGLPEREREENLAALRFASDEAARRGIHFQLGLWNHAVRPELGDSPNLRYPVDGLADEDIAAYSAAALRMLLRECPSIAGLTFRVHYEGGVPEAGHGAFWRSVMGGARDAGRPLDVDMHAKGVDAELIAAAREAGGRVILSAKYWAEHQGLPYHQAAIRPLEHARPASGDGLRGVTQNARRFTRYGYADFLRRDRDFEVLFRIWPGTQRFLLWADPEIFAGYGRMGTIGGALGVELTEPLTFRGRKDTGAGASRDLYADPELTLGTRDWSKYAYEYRLWGRLLFDPEADRETWLRHLRARFGAAAEEIEAALGAAGKILPLVTVTHPLSASNNFFWPEMVFDMPIAREARSSTFGFDLAEPGTWGSLSPFDPAMFESADDHARGLVTGAPSGRYTPVQVASWLEGFADKAFTALDRARDRAPDAGSAEFRRVDVDVQVQALMGRFFAGKIRAGVAYSLYLLTDDPRHLRSGMRHYLAGRDALAEVVGVTRGVYATNLAFGYRPAEHGHWSDRLAQVDDDIKELTVEYEEAAARGTPAGDELRPCSPDGNRPAVKCEPPAAFVPGEPLEICAEAPPGIEMTLHARHLNQAEEYLVLPMKPARNGSLTAEIPADYTASPYPLQFHFVARDTRAGTAWIVPGLDETLAGRPYHVVTAEGRG